jgi:hypothetical protein
MQVLSLISLFFGTPIDKRRHFMFENCVKCCNFVAFVFCIFYKEKQKG